MRVPYPRHILVVGLAAFVVVGGATAGGAQQDDSSCDPLDAARHLNSAPSATDDEAWVRPGESVRIEVLTNDVDFDDDVLTVEAVTTPSSGTATIEGSLIAFVADQVEGPANFQYRVTDGACGADLATVRITVSRDDEPADLAEPATPVTSVPAYAG